MSPAPDPETSLPFVDDHRLLVAAPAAAVWQALGASLPDTAAVRAGAFLLGARPRRGRGGALVAGSSVPGFGVHRVDPGRELVLRGRHHFSDYALVFTLDDHGGSSELAARTLARFPGPHGRVYRALVIGSGAHRVLTRRWLRRIRDLAEAPAPGP